MDNNYIFDFFKPIPNYNGYYISEHGKVYCDLGRGNRRNGKIVDLYEIKPRYTKTGYTRVYMRNSITNKRNDKYIHRLVAENFISNTENKKYVNHKDCIRDNNCVCNLEWVTCKENTDHTYNNNHIIRDKNGRYKSNFNYNIERNNI